jgi:hypothetical protein
MSPEQRSKTDIAKVAIILRNNFIIIGLIWIIIPILCDLIGQINIRWPIIIVLHITIIITMVVNVNSKKKYIKRQKN